MKWGDIIDAIAILFLNLPFMLASTTSRAYNSVSFILLMLLRLHSYPLMAWYEILVTATQFPTKLKRKLLFFFFLFWFFFSILRSMTFIVRTSRHDVNERGHFSSSTSHCRVFSLLKWYSFANIVVMWMLFSPFFPLSGKQSKVDKEIEGESVEDDVPDSAIAETSEELPRKVRVVVW